jgi:hypothetical protein
MKFNNTYININNSLKFILFIITLYIFLMIMLPCYNNKKINENSLILSICAFVSMLYYILDSYYPNCVFY